MADMISFDEVEALALGLSPIEKVRLMECLAATLEQDLKEQRKAPLPSLHGLLADLGPAPSAEDIDEVRREMWSNFPREDI